MLKPFVKPILALVFSCSAIPSFAQHGIVSASAQQTVPAPFFTIPEVLPNELCVASGVYATNHPGGDKRKLDLASRLSADLHQIPNNSSIQAALTTSFRTTFRVRMQPLSGRPKPGAINVEYRLHYAYFNSAFNFLSDPIGMPSMQYISTTSDVVEGSLPSSSAVAYTSWNGTAQTNTGETDTNGSIGPLTDGASIRYSNLVLSAGPTLNTLGTSWALNPLTGSYEATFTIETQATHGSYTLVGNPNGQAHAVTDSSYLHRIEVISINDVAVVSLP